VVTFTKGKAMEKEEKKKEVIDIEPIGMEVMEHED
jgi:hypothetical protein